jgi:capsular polysaccharide biosynthesis protein
MGIPMNQRIPKLARRVRQRLRKLWPRPKGDLSNYHNEFGDTALAFERFIARCLPLPPLGSGQAAAVVVSPWVGTPLPWYSVALAIGLARRGRPITLIWDDTPLPEATPDYLALQNRAIARVTQQLASHMPTVTLSHETPQSLSPEDEDEVTRLAKLIMVWRLKAAPFSSNDLIEVDRMARNMRGTLGRIKGLLLRTPFAYLLVGGGIYASSGLFLWAGRLAKVRASTFDANVGVMQISTYGLAAQQSDIPSAFAEVLKWDATTRERAVGEARRQFERRLQAKDKARYQVAAPNRAAALGVRLPFALLALNIEQDSAALGRHRAFADSREWVLAATTFVLNQSPTASVVVRQHPAERNPFERSRFPIRSILQEHFGAEPRLRFIAAEEPVNTYDLVEQAAVVLPYVSTIGIEAAALGKPVLVAGDSCYSDLEFVWTAPSRERYLELLGRGLRGELGLLPDQVEKAWLCYYLTPVCNRIWTHFSPQPADFWKWQKRSPAELYADAAVDDILTAIDHNVPAALVRHKRSARA